MDISVLMIGLLLLAAVLVVVFVLTRARAVGGRSDQGGGDGRSAIRLRANRRG